MKKSNETNKNDEIKTYSLGNLAILIFLFIIILAVFTFVRNVKADKIINKISSLDKQIEYLEKEVDVLTAEEAKYSAPNRFIEMAIMNGLSSSSGESNIVYLKIESEVKENDN